MHKVSPWIIYWSMLTGFNLAVLISSAVVRHFNLPAFIGLLIGIAGTTLLFIQGRRSA